MKRSHLLFSIVSTYLCLGIVLIGWSIEAFAASSPDISLAVKGASSDGDPASTLPLPSIAPYPTVGNGPIYVQANEFALYNPESGKVLIRSKTMDPVAIASTTKLMTTYLTTQYGNLDDVITVTPEAAGIGGSLMDLHTGEKISVRNLLYGALMVSGNDAAYTLGEYIGGILLHNQNAPYQDRINRFVQEMNSEAVKLSMLNTRYRDPVGLNDNGHSTAVDLAKLSSFVIQQPTLKQIIATSDITVSDQQNLYQHVLHNSDRILTDYGYDGVLGGKTGYTDAAGHCLMTAARRDGHTLIAVVLHTWYTTPDASAIETRKLLDYGFSMTHWQ